MNNKVSIKAVFEGREKKGKEPKEEDITGQRSGWTKLQQRLCGGKKKEQGSDQKKGEMKMMIRNIHS